MKYCFRFGYQDNLEQELPEIRDLKDRFEHTYIVGKTGMGKSTLLERMALYDINQGISTIFIDPKGDSLKKIYSQIEDKSNVHYISIESPVVINPLNKEGYRLDNIIQEFITILDVLVTLTASNPESTVLMREIITMTLKVIKNEEDKNLDFFTRFLLYSEVRKRVIAEANVTEDEYLYWTEFDTKNREKVESAKRVASRLIEISTGEMRDFVIGKNEFDIESIVQNQKTVLVDTSRMNRNSRIYLSNLIVYSVLSYCEFAKKKDKPLLVYVDEFQIVVSNLFSELLARSRSSKVGFTLAHQTFHQLPKNILSDIFGTVNTQICFRCGDEEATRFSTIFGTKKQDIFNLPKYHAWIRLGTDNIQVETYPPKLTEVPDINIQHTLNFHSSNTIETVRVVDKKTSEPPPVQEQSYRQTSIHKQTESIQYNFLGEEWISY
ncbi:MAG: type IV secretion system DNA-binding domain-containing protein [Ignavibacteria bacterium]|nr:type IV secretion system DNA-binding domain-containing protein [Ignavibacteria bacterium]